MSKRSAPWCKWYWSDWRSDPRLRMCSWAARGLWAEMLALMHEADPYGHLLVNGNAPTDAQLAVLAGGPPEQIPELLGELESAGVFSRTQKGVIYSRRMTRDEKKARLARKHGKSGGNPTLGKETGISPSVNPPDKGGVKPQRPEARGQKKSNTATAESGAEAEPPDKPPAAPRWTIEAVNEIAEKVCAAGEIDGQRPIWLDMSAVLGLVEAGYDLDADILATIRGVTRRRGKPANSPGYYVKAIREAAAQRRGAASQRKPVNGGGGPLDGRTDDKWRGHLDRFTGRGKWAGHEGKWPDPTDSRWGPPPGRPGCLVPRHLLEEYELGGDAVAAGKERADG